ncbi:TIGR02281 family clan AA aspartic protease [Diaphorobacter sp. JS3051]|uniref:retropepsin-like aspartic protease family protein n=1 Tax=Diaphorobacter sp. JS3051 TaxID=2792224 RepID=UPI0018C951DA|nr:retroviral-like aspartic protease family protein [Diaphorobacter sp. JS3051]QPN33209.1 retroviral-like aspartic protease family protein [Diaphorobacter sp. JS3051]
MSADERDWYRERAAKTMRDYYYDPKEFRGSSTPCSSTAMGELTVRNALIVTLGPILFASAAFVLVRVLFQGAHPLDAISTVVEFFRGAISRAPYAWLGLAMLGLVSLRFPALAARIYGLMLVGFLCFVAYRYFIPRPPELRMQHVVTNAGIARVASMEIARNRAGRYEIEGTIDGRAVTFSLDGGADVTSIPSSLIEPLGIRSCEPRQLRTPNGEHLGCVTTVSEIVFGVFRAHNVRVAVVSNMAGPIVLGRDVLDVLQSEQRGSALLLWTTNFREDN